MKPRLLLFVLVGLLAVGTAWADTPKIACGTSTLAELTTSLFRGDAEIVVIPEESPLSAATVKQLSDVQVVIVASGQHRLRQDLHTLDQPGFSCLVIKDSSNLLIPANFLKAGEWLASQLTGSYPEWATTFRENLCDLQEQVQIAETESLARSRTKKVMDATCWSTDACAPFLRWLGFRVAGTFGTLTPETVAAMTRSLVPLGPAGFAVLAAEDQDAGDTQRTLAAAGVRWVALQTEPGVSLETTETPAWRRQLDHNVRNLLEGLP